MWMTITSVIALFSFADIGIGYGLLNAVAHARGTGDRSEIVRKVSSGTVMLVVVATCLALLFILAYPLIPWSRVFAVSSPIARGEAGPAMAAWFACFILGLPLSVAAQVRTANQQGYIMPILTGAASLVGVSLLLIAIATHQPLPVLVIAISGPPVLAAAANWLMVFEGYSAWLRPSPGKADARAALQLARVGLVFLVLQVTFAVAFTSDTLVIAQVVGPRAVAEYSVVARLFLVPTFLVATMSAALWPAYGEAISRGDVNWAQQTLKRSVRAALVVSVPSAIVLTLAGSFLIHAWIGDTLHPPLLLLLGFGVWTVLNALGGTVASFLNGAGEIGAQAIASVVMCTANLLLSIWLTARIGVAGAIFGTVLAYSALSLIPLAFYLPRVRKRIEGRGLQYRTSTREGDGP